MPVVNGIACNHKPIIQYRSHLKAPIPKVLMKDLDRKILQAPPGHEFMRVLFINNINKAEIRLIMKWTPY